MRVLVTGSAGQLGHDVVRELRERSFEYFATTRLELDFTDYDSVKRVFYDYVPDIVIHCGGYTDVDRAEIDSNECWLVNCQGTENIAKVCKNIDAKMIYISTDYVFDGLKQGYYEINDPINPQNFYGKSKFEGELRVKKYLRKYFIVRISWAFGIYGKNFVKTMLNLSKNSNELGIVSDQIGSPTYTADLAELLVDMMQTEKYGVYHATNTGECSWAEFAEEIFNLANIEINVKHILSKDYKAIAHRPLNSRLSKFSLQKNGFRQLPRWQDALARYIGILMRQEKRDYEK